MTEEKQRPVSNTRLYGFATLLATIGMLLMFAQAIWWLPERAPAFLLIILAVLPFVQIPLSPFMHKRLHINLNTRYEWHWPAVWLPLGIPVALTVATLLVAGNTGRLDQSFALPLCLALDAGNNLVLWMRCLRMERDQRQFRAKRPD